MRRLSDNALFLVTLIHRAGGSWCPRDTPPSKALNDALGEIVRKKRAYVESTDDGARYHLTRAGVNEAEAADA